uniref:HNH endonuclease n=1 Tax=Ningiella ruwaisensis TaxID=2364274 RepID=UPI00109F5CC1|nr:HNH endonuclease [Ningiella ruwaisensis]
MPTRPGKACRVNSCGNIVKDHSHRGYCEAHKDRAGWHNNERLKGNDTKRGYGWEWRKLRKIVLERDNHLCQICLKKGKAVTGNQCDHIIPKSRGGTDSLSNLQILCVDCHRKKTAKE